MRNFKSLSRALILTLALLLTGGALHAGQIIIRTAPPTTRVVVRPKAPYKRAVWVPGRWAWKRNKYIWVKGYWVKPRKGFVWIPGHWKKARGGWIWIGGYWRRA